MIEIACIDLDGTLLNDGKSISKRNINALRKAKELGIEIVLASGRRYGSILPFTKLIGIECPIVAYSGSLIQHSTEKIPMFHETMSWEYSAELIEQVRDQVDLVGFYLDDIFHIEKNNERSRMYEARTSMKCKVVPDVVSFLTEKKVNPTRIFILSETLQTNGLYYELSEQFKGKLDFVSSWATFLEAGAVGISKGSALKFLAGKYGWNLENAVAFGDQDNDISAFEICGLSYAMDNASGGVKEKAKFVAPCNLEDGVAVVLERLMK